jgi:hypothetical protein
VVVSLFSQHKKPLVGYLATQLAKNPWTNIMHRKTSPSR